MSIYRVAQEDGPHVVLDDEGDVGAYNRANRSLAHLGENVLSFIVPFVSFAPEVRALSPPD